MSEVVRNLERHQMEQGRELTRVKEELGKVRGQRDMKIIEGRMLWERMDFMDKVHHLIEVENVTE